MKQYIIRQIITEAKMLKGNYWENGDTATTYFDEPLVGFASVNDPLFIQYKQDIGAFHLTPQEIFATEFGVNSLVNGTVISIILPISEEVLEANRLQNGFPSQVWGNFSSAYGEYTATLRANIISYIQQLGYQALAPVLSSKWQTLHDDKVGHTSTWSERHAAYAAGLGTFGLAGGLISKRGIAHRTFSIITDLVLESDTREYTGLFDYCLYHNSGTCGVCATRCPGRAVSLRGVKRGI